MYKINFNSILFVTILIFFKNFFIYKSDLYVWISVWINVCIYYRESEENKRKKTQLKRKHKNKY